MQHDRDKQDDKKITTGNDSVKEEHNPFKEPHVKEKPESREEEATAEQQRKETLTERD